MPLALTIRLHLGNAVGFLLFVLCLYEMDSTAGHTQEPSPAQPNLAQRTKMSDQIWVGWIESPESHLRWVVKLQRIAENWTGSIQLPDRISVPAIPLSKLIVSDNSLSFSWQPTNENQEASFVGNAEQPNTIKGLVLQGESSLFSKLKRIDKLENESPDTLGADAVWIDQTPSRAKIIPYDLRLRIYSSGPYFDGEDRILLDSISSNIVGAPVKLNQSQLPKWSFQIPSLKVEYVAELDSTGNTLSGFLMGDANSKALQLFNWIALSTKAAEIKPKNQGTKPQMEDKGADAATAMQDKAPKASDASSNDAVKIKLSESKPSTRTTKDGEDEFLLTVASTGSRSKGDPATHQLGCTLKLPQLPTRAKAPLAIIVSTFDAQERDGVVGDTKIYKQLAFSLAERGVATIRFDDRGTGSSSPVSGDYGLQESVADLKAVLDYARGMPEIDTSKIGFIGHGFGATLASKLTTNDPTIAFLVCLAPVGVNGSELLLAELKKTSELEQLDTTSTELLLDLQKDLHKMALKPSSNETQMSLEFDDLFRNYWPRLAESIAKSSGTATGENEVPEAQIKQAIETKLRVDLSGFRTKFNRDFLRDDPSSSWMIMQIPTIAIWGAKDVQVDAETNQTILKQSVKRNPKGRVSWSVLPNLNHLFQECETGLPMEYQELSAGIAPSAIEAILKWLDEQKMLPN